MSTESKSSISNPAAGALSLEQDWLEGPEPRRFLLIGSERSGSTMFRLMLDHHPELSCMYESDFMVTPYEQCRDEPVTVFSSAIQQDWHFQHSGLTFPDDARTYQDVVRSFFWQRMRTSQKKIIGATIQAGFHCLPKLFPEINYIHLFRDGRPVSASIVNMGWTGNTFYGAKYWRRTVRQVLDLEQHIPSGRWLNIRYEDLVRQPERELSRVCAFLDVKYRDDMLGYATDSTYDPPDPGNADRWRKRMSPREVLEAEMACGDVLERLGYERYFPLTKPSSTEALFLWMSHRIGRFRFNVHRFGPYLVLGRKFWRLLGVRRSDLERRYEMIADAHIK